MIPQNSHRQSRSRRTGATRRAGAARRTVARVSRPVVAFRSRGVDIGSGSSSFSAPETWHEPTNRLEIAYRQESPGVGYVHPVTPTEIADRLSLLPQEMTSQLEVVQLSGMTRKRKLFPLYGMQWGPNIYLYPIEESLIETYRRPPRPEQVIEAKMYGGKWVQSPGQWELHWTAESIRDFYLNNVLIHELGHMLDTRNTKFAKREQYANWFAIEYGYRASRGLCAAPIGQKLVVPGATLGPSTRGKAAPNDE